MPTNEEKLETSDRNFTRWSETESLCTLCSAVVTCATPGFLKTAEDVHSKCCRMQPHEPVTTFGHYSLLQRLKSKLGIKHFE